METVRKFTETFSGPTSSAPSPNRANKATPSRAQSSAELFPNEKEASPSPRRENGATLAPSLASTARAPLPVTTSSSFFGGARPSAVGQGRGGEEDVLAQTDSSLITAKLRVMQELQLVDEYALFNELYHHMGALYQVMKTTVGASANVVGASSPNFSQNQQGSASRGPSHQQSKRKERANAGGSPPLLIIGPTAVNASRTKADGSRTRSDSVSVAAPTSPTHANANSSSIFDVVRQSFTNLARPSTNASPPRPASPPQTTSKQNGSAIKTRIGQQQQQQRKGKKNSPASTLDEERLRIQQHPSTGGGGTVLVDENEERTVDAFIADQTVKKRLSTAAGEAVGVGGGSNEEKCGRDGATRDASSDIVEGHQSDKELVDDDGETSSSAGDTPNDGLSVGDTATEQRNVGKHYYLILPKDESLQSLIVQRTERGASVLPTFAASPEQKRRERMSNNNSMRISRSAQPPVAANNNGNTTEDSSGAATSLLAAILGESGQDGNGPVGECADANYEDECVPRVVPRIRHNVVRCHIFQGEQRRTAVRRRRLPAVGGNPRLSINTSATFTNGNDTSAEPSPSRHPASQPISLQGLSGLNGSVVFHIGEEDDERSTAHDDADESAGQKAIATVTITPVAMPISSIAASVNTSIGIIGFNTIGNLTILYADKAVVQPNAPNGLLSPYGSTARDPSQALANSSFNSPPSGGSGGGGASNSQMWWQRIPISALTHMPTVCDPPPVECPMAAATAEQEDDELREAVMAERTEKRRAAAERTDGNDAVVASSDEDDAPIDLPKRIKILNYFPEPQIAALFREDEQRFVGVLQRELEQRNFPVDDMLTALDTEVAMFNSAYVCMKGFEGFIVSKVNTIVEASQESLFAHFEKTFEQRQLARRESPRACHSHADDCLSPNTIVASVFPSSVSSETTAAKDASCGSVPPLAAIPKSTAAIGVHNACNAVGSARPVSPVCGSPPARLSSTSHLLAPNARGGSARVTSYSSARSVGGGDCEAQFRAILSDDDEEQVGAVLHVIVTSGIAQKLNSHWSSVHSVEDYAFSHACISLRKSIEKRLPEFLPDICVGKVTTDTFAPTIRLCRFIDSPAASIFSIMRAMEASISSVVTIVTDCCPPGKTHEVTADVCIPMIVLVLILSGLQHLPSRIKLILELIAPVLELSSLGYALTTFEASAEQIHYEYAQMVANRS